MNVSPIGSVHPSFGRWLERRRERMLQQLNAIDEERFHDLARLIDDDHDDPPPQPRSRAEHEEYKQMLEENEHLVRRLAQIRSRLLIELRDVEREQVKGAVPERRRSLGGSLDGYL